MPSDLMTFRERSLGLALGLLLAVGGGANLGGQTGGFYRHAPAVEQSAPVTVAGTVVNAVNGTPVARALVQIGGRAVLTDHDGKFEFDQFVETGGSIQVTKPGYYSSLDPGGGGATYLSAAKLNEAIRLRLYPEALLTGSVTASVNGEPLRGIQVSAMRSVFDDNGHRWVPAGVTQTNAHGQFRIPVPAGKYRLETQYRAMTDADQDVIMPIVFPDNTSSIASGTIEIHSGEEQRFDLHPAKGPAYIVSASLEPAGEYAMVRALTGSGLSFQVSPVREGDGIYRLKLPSGNYTLSATKYGPEGQEVAETNVTVAGRDVSGVVLRFSSLQALPVEMRVDPSTSDNATAPNVLSLGLMLKSMNPNMDQSFVGVFPARQKDGSVVFHVSPGSYRLQARYRGQWFVESATYGARDLLRQEMVIAQGSGGGPIEVTVSNRTGSLEGMTSVKGVPDSSWIYLVPSTPGATTVISNIRSDATRGYRTDLAPGTYQAIAFESRYSADWSRTDALAPFAAHVRTVTIHAGEKATLDLDAVTEEEIAP